VATRRANAGSSQLCPVIARVCRFGSICHILQAGAA
jgi:hypothetical protein